MNGGNPAGKLSAEMNELTAPVKIFPMKSAAGNAVPNQYIIKEDIDPMSGNAVEYFQSYGTIIAKRDRFRAGERVRQVWLDAAKWDYSKTTGKYRNQFLGETKTQTEKKIASGEYLLVDLNGGA